MLSPHFSHGILGGDHFRLSTDVFWQHLQLMDLSQASNACSNASTSILHDWDLDSQGCSFNPSFHSTQAQTGERCLPEHHSDVLSMAP